MVGFNDCEFNEIPLIPKTIIYMLFLIGVFGGIIIGEITYEYEINKCDNLKDTSYNFDFKIEKDANYAQSCYYYRNYPLAQELMIGKFLLVGLLIMCIPYVIIHSHYDMKNFYEKLEKKYR